MVSVPDLLNSMIPSEIRVVFPTAMKGGVGYRRDEGGSEPGKDYVTGRYHEVISTQGKPDGFGGNGTIVSVWDSEWAIFQEDPPGSGFFILDNEPEIEARAGHVAESYYARFSSGAGGEAS